MMTGDNLRLLVKVTQNRWSSESNAETLSSIAES